MLKYLHLLTHANILRFRSMCYSSRFFISKLNARGSGYVLERMFTEFGEIT